VEIGGRGAWNGRDKGGGLRLSSRLKHGGGTCLSGAIHGNPPAVAHYPPRHGREEKHNEPHREPIPQALIERNSHSPCHPKRTGYYILTLVGLSTGSRVHGISDSSCARVAGRAAASLPGKRTFHPSRR
jgi:hypothetical protein